MKQRRGILNIIVVIISIILFGFAVLSLRKSISIISSIHTIWWTFFIVLAIILYNTEEWNCFGLLYIQSTCVVMFLGEFIGRKMLIPKMAKQIQSFSPSNKYHTCIENSAWLMLGCFIILASIGQLFTLRNYGFSILSFFNINSYLSMNAQIAYARYNQTGSGSAFVQLFLTFSYIAPLCGGYCLYYAETLFQKIVACFSILPITFCMLFTNTKAGFIGSIMLFAIGYIIAYLETKKNFPKVTFTVFCKFILLFSFLLIILFIVMCVRVGDFSKETIAVIKIKFAEYAVGHMEAFEMWFEKYRENMDSLQLGANTFLALADKIGLKEKTQGVYSLIPEASSNVFTAFRGIITDFGIVGSLVFFQMIGLLGGVSEKFILNMKGALAKMVYASLLFFILYSFVVSPWVYTTYILIFPCFGLFCYLSKFRIKLAKVKINHDRKYIPSIEKK